MPNNAQQTNEIQRRSFALRAQSDSNSKDGGGSGIASVLGVMDSYRSVWSPKCYDKKVLAEFKQAGFISDSHKWDEDVATIDDAKVSRNELSIKWTYYSTDDAQQMRTKVSERIERQKEVGLSVGCMIDWAEVEDFDNGEKLWTYAERMIGDDMSLYDPAIRKYKGYCWIIPKVTRLVEVALTPIPAVPGSRVDESRSAIDLLQDSDLRTGLRLEEHLRLVQTAVAGLEARLIDKEQDCESQGRVGYVDRVPQIVALRDSLSALLTRCSTPEPQQVDDVTKRLADIEVARRLALLG